MHLVAHAKRVLVEINYRIPCKGCEKVFPKFLGEEPVANDLHIH